MKTYKIYMIRHGLTAANLEGRYCGTTDIPLCEEGRKGLLELLDQYEYPYVDTVYSSPLLRSRETAEILFPGCEYIAVDNLREASFGRFEMMKMKDLQHDEEFQKWVVPGQEYTPPGMESSKEFYVRCRAGVIQVIDDMMTRRITSAAIVTHISVIGASLSALAYPRMKPYEWNCDAGCGFMLRADPSLYLREPLVEYVGEIPTLHYPKDPKDPFEDLDY